jgi:exonuclease III
MAFRKKKERVLQRDPDVVVVQECENPGVRGEWDEFSDWAWIGENEHKGLGVFSRNDITVDPLATESSTCRYALPVTLGGERDLLAVWAMNEKSEPKRRYIGQVYTALQQYSEHVDSTSIVAGDFNWNSIWDESPKSPLYGNFSDTVDILDERDLCSAYHSLKGCEYGSEIDPTFFMHKKHDRPYHIDYVFLPREKVDSVVDFSVGTYDGWIEFSDHVPLTVDIEE